MLELVCLLNNTLGLLLQILSWMMLATVNLKGFAICNILGIILMLISYLFPLKVSSMFLMGPTKQFKRMFKRSRLVTTLILLATIILTLIMGLIVKSTILTLLFSIAAWFAYAWYLLSYIPFAQRCVKNCITSCFNAC